ncbi:uncharacterized protein LOC120162254 [Hibiscus syriacus]|uniref:uncharacterized protein LOC120162254 n=1 Tax=Hibiscus syriacus TaxID=106335 RepID=UPI0019212035|nr:uncharacterized protein LOC120162254 [Hibiscus syriacus]
MPLKMLPWYWAGHGLSTQRPTSKTDAPTCCSGPSPIYHMYGAGPAWTIDFSPTQPHPSKFIAWIRLPDLPVTLYKRSMITAIGENIDLVIRIDYQTGSGRRRRFARMAVSVDLNKPLISKIIVNGRTQIIEYESVPIVCFNCGTYGHSSNSCPKNMVATEEAPTTKNEPPQPIAEESKYGPWMLVEKRQCKPVRKIDNQAITHKLATTKRSRFSPVAVQEDSEPSQDAPTDLGRRQNNENTNDNLAEHPSMNNKGKDKLVEPSKNENLDPNIPVPNNSGMLIDDPTSEGYSGEPPDPRNSNCDPFKIGRVDSSKTQLDSMEIANEDNFDEGLETPIISGTISLTSLVLWNPVSVALGQTPLLRLWAFPTPIELKRLAFREAFDYPKCHKKTSFWTHLRSLASQIQAPWILPGDFNATLVIVDRKGGFGSSHPCKYFQDFLVDFDLRDMGFHDPPWTCGLTHARLDRALCNNYWDDLFLESIGNLPKSTNPTHFKYLSSWHLHDDFHRMVQDNWTDMGNPTETIAKFSKEAEFWNKSVFGYIRSQKRRVMARLRGVQKALQIRNSSFLHNLEISLLSDLESLLDQEGLLSPSHFVRLFSVHDPHEDSFPCRGKFPLIPSTTWTALDATPSSDEIRSALNDMAPLKAPGYDGLHADFFQKQWSIVGNSI